MSESILIACETLKEEIKTCLTEPDNEIDIVWMNGGLHISPENLRRHLQKEVNTHDGLYKNILIGYGFCGGGVEHLETRSSNLIIPRVEDCISILLGGNSRRQQIIERDMPVLLTKGWIRTFNQMEGLNLTSLKKKYGKDQAATLYRQIYNGYRSIDIIETGAYTLDEIDGDISEITDVLELPCKKVGGSLVLIEKLVKGQWDDDFVVKGPGRKIEKNDYN